MLDLTRLNQIINKCFPYNGGAFYGPGTSVSLGVGKIYNGIRVPEWHDESGIFDTYERSVFVLTHECDVDQNNDRHFNDRVLVCPIIPVDVLAETYAESGMGDVFFRLLPDIASDRVFRVFLLPPGMPGDLNKGGVLELNSITSTSVNEFYNGSSNAVCALSEYGQSIFDKKLYNHLLRPKSDRLPQLQ